METFYFNKTSELKREFATLQKKLNVKMQLIGSQLTIEGEAINEFSASHVLEAMVFGFSAKKSLMLLEPDIELKIIKIKDNTRRKDLEDVRSRIIGKEGKTKHTIENVSGCFLELNGNEVGILGPVEAMDSAVQALKNIIKGSKQANVYSYLERMNRTRRKLLNASDDLGLKLKDKDLKSYQEY